MSQSMATKHMAALEGRLGVRLLHRSTRRITLTEAGQRYLESAERIIEELERADAVAAAERVEVSGELRVNAPVSFAVRVLAPMLPDFLSRHPALRVERPDLPGIEPAWITEAGGLRLRPDYWSARGGMDGFFIARLVRDA